MGLLVEQSIPALFGGISNQPPEIRFKNQVEDAENVVFAVEDGGFTKRCGTELRSVIGADVGPYVIHTINRDANEKYIVVVGGGNIRVFDALTWTERQVHWSVPADYTFFQRPPSDFQLLSMLDYTLIVDKTRFVGMLPRTHDTACYAVVNISRTGLAGRHTVVVSSGAGTHANIFFDATSSSDAASIASNLFNLLDAALDASWTVAWQDGYVAIQHPTIQFTVVTYDPHGGNSLRVMGMQVENQTDLMPVGFNGHTVEVRGNHDEEGVFLKFATTNGGGFGRGRWHESVNRTSSTHFDPGSMPRKLVRNGDGSFTFDRISWSPKVAGGELLVPAPEFVGQRIYDMALHRNRLALVTDETVYFSETNDFFNFWPKSATEVLETDPFGLTSTTNNATKFIHVVPFRRSLFVMADLAQFEIGGDYLSPSKATIDLATSYSTSETCSPVSVGDELYFVASADEESRLLAYTYSEQSVSEIAHDVSKHVAGLLPNRVKRIVADPITYQLYLLSPDDPSRLYTYRYYFQNGERVQSAWSRLHFPEAHIHDAAYLNGEIVLLTSRNGQACIETMKTHEPATDLYPWVPRMDQRKSYGPNYDATKDETVVDCLLPPTDRTVVMTNNGWSDPHKMISLQIDRIEGNLIYIKGRWDANPLLVGLTYDSFVTLSRLHYYEGEESVISGRLQMRSMTLSYNESGFFEVVVCPTFRPPRVRRFNGRDVDRGDNLVQNHGISSGTFRFRVGAQNTLSDIRIQSTSFLPFTITSASWTGYFNEISRQDRN